MEYFCAGCGPTDSEVRKWGCLCDRCNDTIGGIEKEFIKHLSSRVSSDFPLLSDAKQRQKILSSKWLHRQTKLRICGAVTDSLRVRQVVDLGYVEGDDLWQGADLSVLERYLDMPLERIKALGERQRKQRARRGNRLNGPRMRCHRGHNRIKYLVIKYGVIFDRYVRTFGQRVWAFISAPEKWLQDLDKCVSIPDDWKLIDDFLLPKPRRGARKLELYVQWRDDMVPFEDKVRWRLVAQIYDFHLEKNYNMYDGGEFLFTGQTIDGIHKYLRDRSLRVRDSRRFKKKPWLVGGIGAVLVIQIVVRVWVCG